MADRITYREHSAITGWNWNMDQQYWYGYTGEGSASSFMRNANWDIVEKTVQLPGGVLMTIYPQQTGNSQKQYSFQSVLGRTLLTTNAAGANTSSGNGPMNSFTYDPFGNALTGSVLPANTTGGSYGFGGTLQKLTETSLVMKPIQMGARLYLSTLGRFTAVDPVLGGAANAYAYALDPINYNDYSGKCILQCTANVSSLQPAAAVQYVQPAPNISRVQNASTRPLQAKASQPVVPRPTVRPPVTPVVYPVATIGIDMSKIKNTTWAGVPVPEPKKSVFSSVMGQVWETTKAAAMGCASSVAALGATAGTAMMVVGFSSGGTSLLPSAGAFGMSCLTGAGGGAAIHLMTSGQGSEYDTSMMYDSYDYLNKTFR